MADQFVKCELNSPYRLGQDCRNMRCAAFRVFIRMVSKNVDSWIIRPIGIYGGMWREVVIPEMAATACRRRCHLGSQRMLITRNKSGWSVCRDAKPRKVCNLWKVQDCLSVLILFYLLQFTIRSQTMLNSLMNILFFPQFPSLLYSKGHPQVMFKNELCWFHRSP